MAALVVTPDFDLNTLHRHLDASLPAYARPLFVRICGELATTATFKHRKDELARAGFDPAATRDALYVYDPRLSAFVRLDSALYDLIRAGQIRF
jgi:fatty-acyl-CoA synthase